MFEKELSVAKEAAGRAGDILRSYFAKQVEVEHKGDQSPVTVADREAEEAIIHVLSTHFPSHGFLGEESGAHDTGASFVWIIDPLDGTKKFIRDLPYFATQIALQYNGEIVLGLSYAPVLDQLVFATKGGGAFLNGDRLTTRRTERISEAHICHSSLKRWIGSPLFSGLGKIAEEAERLYAFGDYYNYQLLASGHVDAVVEVGSKFWDIAAFLRIIEEAGGVVTTCDGQSIQGNPSSVLAAANPTLHQALLSKFSV